MASYHNLRHCQRRQEFIRADAELGVITGKTLGGNSPCVFPALAGDELALLASTRQCLQNGIPREKERLLSILCRWRQQASHHTGKSKSEKLYEEFQKMQDVDSDY
ncbi:hypothetical protein SDC9_13867 [bioreactor metagenome]|uniref:Uncharacterized protein n=1 Tax=bioreactor metagenome TaxID=1076179 RepID=A0A644TMP7_9ZZZZ